MIKINGKEVTINRFPDGTLLLHPMSNNNEDILVMHVMRKFKPVDIEWKYENNEEMISLMFITKHLQNNGINDIELIMPYIPNARQDRVKDKREDVFTLKYFAEFINSLGFCKVTVLDPHSSVSEALINNISIENPSKYINSVIDNIYKSTDDADIIAFYPDEGSMKRYSSMSRLPYAFGIKKRDWKTGNIIGLDASGDVDLISGNNILIIDDISSRGGTFYHSAKKLKELGANKIYLYVSHCEETILDGEVFTSGLIEKVFTTDSIFTDKAYNRAKELGIADKIEVLKYEKD